MVNVSIFYSIQKNENNLPTIAFFADEICAKLDQEFFQYWDVPCWGSFRLDVSGVAYIDAVKTTEQYIEELMKLPSPPEKLIQRIQR